MHKDILALVVAVAGILFVGALMESSISFNREMEKAKQSQVVWDEERGTYMIK